jgi:UDP-3-O-[3-hydroxymyristoyl] glucosamine N-acyltransferase
MNVVARGRSEPEAMTLGRIAELVGGRLIGDPGLEVDGVAPVDEAGPRQMAFLAAKRYARFVEASRAGSYLVSDGMERFAPEGLPRVVVGDAYPALRTLLEHFFPKEFRTASIHPTAVIGRGAQIGASVSLGPYAVLEDDVSVGDGCTIGAHAVVGRGTSIGPRSHLYPHVVVYHDCVIGADVILHAGARIGSDGFGYTFVDGEHRKMPQVGRCVIEDGVEVGANTTIDRGSLGDTIVGRGTKIDNLVQVAHNVRVGALTLMAALVGIAGSTRIGRQVWIGGQAGLINQLDVGDGARIAVAAKVMRDVAPGETMSGHPARPHREDLRRQARIARLPKRVDDLEEAVSRLAGA